MREHRRVAPAHGRIDLACEQPKQSTTRSQPGGIHVDVRVGLKTGNDGGVLDHRRELLAHTGARGREEGFRLAVMTAFQELAAHGEQSAWAADTSRLLGVVDLIAAQQTVAVIAATSASTSAATSS